MSSDTTRSTRASVVYYYANFLVFGGIGTTAGATLPLVIRHFEWSYLAAGWIFAASAAGYFLSTFVTGLVLPHLGIRRLMVVGLLLQAIGIGGFGTGSSLPINMVMFVILGLGQGAVEVSINVGVVRIETPGQSRLMNLVHSAFTIGAMAAPFMAGFLAWMQAPWRWVYMIMAAVAVGMLVWTVRAGSWMNHHESQHASNASGNSREHSKLRDPLLVFLAATIFFYVGAEIGISNWIAEYFVKIHQTSASVGALMVALFWFGVFLGRMAHGLWDHGKRQGNHLLISSLGSLVALLLAIWIRMPWLSALLFFLTGVGYSIVYPCVMSLIGMSFPKRQSAAIGMVSTSGGLGVFLFPFAMSALSERFGLVNGFQFYLGLTVLMCVCIVISLVLLRGKKRLGQTSRSFHHLQKPQQPTPKS
jgi:fucose permease